MAESIDKLDAHTLSRRRLLARNVGWNLLGVLLPLAVAVFSIPVLVSRLGEGRFGLLSLSWVFIGYFNIFDLGFGRALTKLVSNRVAQNQQSTIPGLMATALASVLGLSFFTCTAVFLAAPTLVSGVMHVPAELEGEAIGVLRILALTIPFVIIGTVLRGALEAFQRFDLVNLVRLSSGLYLFIGPLLMLPFTRDMTVLVGMLALGKVAGTLMFLRLTLRQVPELTSRLGWNRAEFRALFVFGGWITLGNILGPMLSYTDHFLVGALVSVSMVGYYIVPYQMVTKLWVIVTAMVGVLFPALSITLVSQPERAQNLFATGMKAVLLVVAPVAWLLSAYSGEVLQLWLNPDYGRIAGPLLQIFALGVFINSFSIVTLALVQAAGRPDWVPRLFLCELPFYLPALYYAIGHAGLSGGALVWAGKIVIDFVFLLWAVQRLLPATRAAMRAAALPFLLLLASFLPLYMDCPLGVRIGLTLAWVPAFVGAAWFWVLSPAERASLQKKITSAMNA